MRFPIRKLAAVAAILSATAISACGSDLTTPSDGDGNPAQGSAVAALENTLVGGGTSRIEIHLLPGEIVAREVEVETDDDEEKIESQLTAIDPGAGTITLELGGLVVTYDAGTRFRTETESHESRETWEVAVQSELEAGGHPMIEARRSAPGTPQAPDDPTFVAADLRLEGEVDEPTIEIYVDDDNLESVNGSSDAVLRLLGLGIEVNGQTQLGDDHGDDDNGDVEFEAGVTDLLIAATSLRIEVDD